MLKLDVSGCKGFGSAGLVVPPLGALRELRACRLPGLTQLVLHLPASHPLSHLDLSGCHYLKLVDLALNNLVSLNLSACRTLYRLRLRCASLKSLVLSQSGSLHDFHADAWQVPALQQLNLFGCRRTSGQQLAVVLQGLTDLRRLSINGCWGIATMHLTAQLQLESYDISGCRNLVAFSSSSTCLSKLVASSCGRLYSLASSQLGQLQLAICRQLSEVYVAAGASTGAGAGGAGGGSRRGQAGRSLNVNGCTLLSPDAKARQVAAVAGR